jgi:hypothetical protein
MRTRTSASGRRQAVGDGGVKQFGIVARLDVERAASADLVERLGELFGEAAERADDVGMTRGEFRQRRADRAAATPTAPALC